MREFVPATRILIRIDRDLGSEDKEEKYSLPPGFLNTPTPRAAEIRKIMGMRDLKNFVFGAPFFVVSFPLTKYEAPTVKRGMTKNMKCFSKI